MVRRLGVYNLYLLATVITVLPISTMMTERRQLEAKLRARTLAAQQARREAATAAQAKAASLGTTLMMPLGACVLPAFMLLGVAPMMISLFSSTVTGLS